MDATEIHCAIATDEHCLPVVAERDQLLGEIVERQPIVLLHSSRPVPPNPLEIMPLLIYLKTNKIVGVR